MKELNKKYDRIKNLLSDIDSNIDKLRNEDLFFQTLEILRKEIEEIKCIRSELKNITISKNFPEEAKQIQYKFDNIIDIKKREAAEIQMKLSNLLNSRNLIKYMRE